MIGIRSRETLNSLAPNFEHLAQLSKSIDCNGYFVFTFDSDNPEVLTYGRMFAPAIGIPEDPVTGNANGPLGGYLIQNNVVTAEDPVFEFKGRQGEPMNRLGEVRVRVHLENGRPSKVQIVGEASEVIPNRNGNRLTSKQRVYMSIPQFPKIYDQEVIITPRQHLSAEMGSNEITRVPESVVICFESYLMEHFKQQDQNEYERFWTGEILYLKNPKNEIALVGNFGIGGAAACHMMEILIAAGAKNFIVVGHAGGLQKSDPIGRIFLTDKSIRDEGVSHHYLTPEKYAYPSPSLTKKIESRLIEESVRFEIGSSWSIASMYRETKDEIENYAKEGVATVEMELASLFAVAAFRKVDIASLMVISDHIHFEKWEEHLHSESTSKALLDATQIAITTLTD